MNKHNRDRKLREKVEQQVRRIQKGEREQHGWLSQTVYLGTLGVVFVLPLVAGAYLGRWLDSRLEGYSFSWTVSLICAGVVVGGINVYLLLRE